jgi:hypothetical protein
MHKCNPTPSPIVKGVKFEKFQYLRNQYDINEMKAVPYASVVESLMYAQVFTRPDLVFVTGGCLEDIRKSWQTSLGWS